MDRIMELRSALMDAKESLKDAKRRAKWLERRMYRATSEEEFSSLSAELKATECSIAELDRKAMLASYDYAMAEKAV